MFDRNHISGGGITAGLDFGMEVIRRIGGDDIAKFSQLAIEYDPHPPFNSGSPQTADPKVVAMVQGFLGSQIAAADAAATVAQKRLGRS